MNFSKKIFSEKVCRNFSRAAFAYERAAYLQRQAAEKFSSFLLEHLPHNFNPRLIMELGAGTGFVTRKILPFFENSQFLITDISDDMLTICRRKIFSMTAKKDSWQIEFQILDFNEDFDIPETCDLLVSGFSFQWATNLSDLITKIHTYLPDNSFLAFSTLTSESLMELRSIFERNRIHYPVPRHPSFNEIRSFCTRFSLCISEQYSLETIHSSLKSCLYSLKNVGAVNPGLSVINPVALKKIIQFYPGEFKAVYHVANVICRK